MNHGSNALAGSSILVLEDDYYLATDLQQALEGAGATVIGPFGDAGQAAGVLSKTSANGAFVDVNLGAGPSFDVPRLLLEANIPFVFVTGYDAGTIPSEFDDTPRLEKPVDPTKIIDAAIGLMEGYRLPD